VRHRSIVSRPEPIGLQGAVAAADTGDVDAAPQTVPYRRIGTILVEKELITEDQLQVALAEQRDTGRPLGEICVDRFRLDRLSLADALAEQWEEMQRHDATPAAVPGAEAELLDTEGAPARDDAEDELRVLLDEAQSARDELAAKTEELGRRLAALEVLVIGVTDALSELRVTPAAGDPPKRAAAKRPRSRTARPAAAA
jgi:hypothetical protein